MDHEQVFAGLDSVRWAELEHAYGEADDLPGMLRALAGDDEQSAEALDELWSSILHQGTVYAATVQAVPFLAQLAAAGTRTVDLLVLLGGIAESDDAYGLPDPGACRAAVASQLPLILPLLASADARVRQAAVWTAGSTGTASAVPQLRRLWDEETEPGVRAEVLAALVRLDHPDAADAARAAMAPGEPAELRVVAAMACLDAGLPWTPAHRDTLVSLLPADRYVAGRFDQTRTEPLHHVVDTLLRRDTDQDRSSAYELIRAALAAGDPEARKEALWAAEHACMISRSAPGRLAPSLLALLKGGEHTASLLPILDKLGVHAEPAAPALAAIAAAGGDLADRALAVLVRVSPHEAAPLLARDLPDRSRALAAACGFPVNRPERDMPYAPELLNAIRIRLTEDELAGNEPIWLTGLLADWGVQAAAALPELTAVVDRFPAAVPRALAAVCPPDSRDATADVLRRAATTGPPEGRYAAADALWNLTGETGPLVDELRRRLEQSAAPDACRTAGALGEEGACLVPQLRSALTPAGRKRTVPELNADIQTALALWRLTGEAKETVDVLAGVLAEASEGTWTRWSLREAALAAAQVGPAAQALTPALEVLLDDPSHAPAAISALRAISGGPDPVRTAEILLTSVERNADADTALDALGALGPEALTPPVSARLKALAERDLRVVTSGVEPGIVPADERLRERARKLLGA